MYKSLCASPSNNQKASLSLGDSPALLQKNKNLQLHRQKGGLSGHWKLENPFQPCDSYILDARLIPGAAVF